MQVSSLVADMPRGDVYVAGGDGVWRSSNSGATWMSLGLAKAGVITLMVAPRPAGEGAATAMLFAVYGCPRRFRQL